jgi:hypothetical protein
MYAAWFGWDPDSWAAIGSFAAIAAAFGIVFLERYLSSQRPADISVERIQPAAFGGWLNPDEGPERRLMLRFVFVLNNVGSKTGVISGMRLSHPPEWLPPGKEQAWMAWDGVNARSLESAANDDEFAHPFAVAGSTSVAVTCRFRARVWVPSMVELKGTSYVLRLQTRGTADEWTDGGELTLHLSERFFEGWDPRRPKGPFAHWNRLDGDGPPDA